MSCIHYKFSNTVENDKVKFDGLHISVADLRDAIIKQKGLKANLYTLKIIDSQTKKEYSDVKEMLPRNSSVVVSRVPLANAQRVPKARVMDPTLPQSDSLNSKPSLPSARIENSGDKMLTMEELKKTADLVNANATEEEKVKAMISQSGEGYDPSQYVWTPRNNAAGVLPGLRKNPPPPGYTCNRCGIRGHWIQFCPTNGDPNFNFNRYKRPTGTPMSQIVNVTEDVPGAMLDRHGKLVVRAVDLKALQDFKKKNKPAAGEAPKEEKPPPELICGLCEELIKDAVIIPCCGESYCYDCIQEYLCENEFTCPGCKKEGISPETLAPNKALRMSAKNFQMKAAEDRSVAMASTTGFIKKEAPSVVVVKPAEAATDKKAALADSASEKPTTSSKPASPVRAGQGEETKEASKDVVEEMKVGSPKVAKSPERNPASIPGQEALNAMAADLKLSKSRSGSPASMGGVAIMGKEAMLQSSLATTALPGAHTGIPLTATGLLGPPAANLLGGRHPASALYPQMLGVPHSMLPGQTSLVPTQTIAPKPTSSDPTKLDKLAAELLLKSAMSKKKRASPSPPPPLSIDEFYRHQKILKSFTKSGLRGSSAESSSSRSYSRSNSSDSSDSSSPSRSRSRSPHHSRTKHKHKRHEHSKRHKRGREHEEGRGKRHKEDREGKKGKSKHRSKRKRHESPTAVLDETKSKRSHHHRSPSRSLSPEKKLSLEEVGGVLVPSTEPSTALNTPSEMGSVVGEESSQRKSKHKRKSKKKHKHRYREEKGRRGSEGEGELPIEEQREEGERQGSEGEDGMLSAAKSGEQGAKIGSDQLEGNHDGPLVEGNGDSAKLEQNGNVTESERNVDGAGLEGNGDSVVHTDSVPVPEGSVEGLELEGTGDVPVTMELLSPLGDGLEVFVATDPLPGSEVTEKGQKGSVDTPQDAADSMGVATKPEEAREVSEKSSNGEVGKVGVAYDEMAGDAMEIAVHAEDDSALLADTVTEPKEEGEGGKEEEKAAEAPPPPSPLTMEDLPEILDQLELLVDTDWLDLGLELHVPGRKLTQMQQKCPVEGLEKVIVHWLEHSNAQNCTWGYLVEALRGMGKRAMAQRISKKHLQTGKEEGEISDDSEEGAHAAAMAAQNSDNLPDLRETLNSSQLLSSEPDLRETINSHKNATSRKRLAPVGKLPGESGEGGEEEEEEDLYTLSQKSAKRRKTSGKAKKTVASNLQVCYSYSSSADTDSGCLSSESEEEKFLPTVKQPKPKRRHSSAKKHKSQDKSRGDSKRHRRKEEKKSKKEKKRRNSSRDHKHSSKSSHRKGSLVDRAQEDREGSLVGARADKRRRSKAEREEKKIKKLKKHKKSSRSHH